MDSESSSPGPGAALGRWWGQSPQPSPSTDVMNQLCRVCGEPAAGFHFGAFTCEGCKSFFGRTYNNLGSITECKNNGECVINKKNRTACKACRLRKCFLVGMSKSGSRYGRRSNWFKIHCLLQEQQQAVGATPHLKEKSGLGPWGDAYKPLPPEDSKGSPTEDSASLGNSLPRDSPGSGPYSAETAAAFWAARHSFFPVAPHLPVPFLHPFSGFPTPGHAHPQRHLLLPFIQNLHGAPAHRPPSSPSRSSQGSVCSQSPSPRHHPSPDSAAVKMAEEHSLALLRALGPVQEQPMDLSQAKRRRKSKAAQRLAEESAESDVQEDADSNNDENFNKRKTPLDLTKPAKLEI